MKRLIIIILVVLVVAGGGFVLRPSDFPGARVVDPPEAEQVWGSQTTFCFYYTYMQVCTSICGFDYQNAATPTPGGNDKDKYQQKPTTCDNACTTNCRCTVQIVDTKKKCS